MKEQVTALLLAVMLLIINHVPMQEDTYTIVFYFIYLPSTLVIIAVLWEVYYDRFLNRFWNYGLP